MKKLSESEQYYARKNRRREWWGKHWWKFIAYPNLVLAVAFGAYVLLQDFSIAVFQYGKKWDKEHHPQDWQHWHWTTNCYFTNVVIYNRS